MHETHNTLTYYYQIIETISLGSFEHHIWTHQSTLGSQRGLSMLVRHLHAQVARKGMLYHPFTSLRRFASTRYQMSH